MAEWSIPLDRLAVIMKTEIETVVRMAAMECFTRVIARSPVDTGRFRANWNLSYDNIDRSTSESTDSAGAIGAVQAGVMKMPVGGTYWLTNSLPYAETLEYGLYPNPPKKGTGKTRGGFSRQAPHGMVRITLREFAGDVRRAVWAAKGKSK